MNIEGNTLIQVTNSDIIDGHFIVPEGIEIIGDWAFEDCTSIISITIPPSVKEIGNGTFRNCTSLTSITLPPSVDEIGYETFHNCHKLNEVNCEDEEIKDLVRFQALIGRPVFSSEQFKKLSQMATKNE